MIPPCYHCPERHIGCHATCKQYLAWCKINEKALSKRKEEREIRDVTWRSAQRAMGKRRRDR